MKLYIEQSEIDTAIRLCNEYNQKSDKRENDKNFYSEKELAKLSYNDNPDPFYTFLLNLEGVKLTELSAIMHYGIGKSFSFDNFEQSLEHCSSMPEAARRSEIYMRTIHFAENVQIGLKYLHNEGRLPSKDN